MWYKNSGKMKNIYTTTLSVTADQVRIKFVFFFSSHFPFFSLQYSHTAPFLY